MLNVRDTVGRILPETPQREDLGAHVARFGPLQHQDGDLIAELDQSGLRGRGGAGFPTAAKWRAVREHRASTDRAVVVANGCESEPASLKDRTLLALRPHLVLDGLELAAEAVGATAAILYISRAERALERSLRAAIGERGRRPRIRTELFTGPARYVAGEETAIVARLNGRPAKPRVVPPRPYADGVWGCATLIHNVETLAHVALIARHGAGWFRSAGTPGSPGTALVTVAGAVRRPGVLEVAFDETVEGIVERAGGAIEAPQALLIGGYFGRWAAADRVWRVAVESRSLRALGLSLGTGVIAVLPASGCGVFESDRVAAFLAAQSSGQCGPCVHGLASLAEVFHAVATGRAREQDLERLARWTQDIRGRGACRHPDGATLFMASALQVFAADLRRHLHNRPCHGARIALLPTPETERGWR